MRPAFLSGLGNPRFHTISQDVALELGEYGKHAGQGAATRGRHIKRLGKRDKSNADGIELLQAANQVE
jgi:hypothetical protein